MRKLLLLAFITVSLTSCMIQYSVTSLTVDYSKYTIKEFFVTESNSVSFPYDPIGSIQIVSTSGYEVKHATSTPTPFSDGTVYKFKPSKEHDIPTSYGKWKECSLKDAFDKLYDTAQPRGANGVINVKYTYIQSKDQNKWIVTGMLIKR